MVGPQEQPTPYHDHRPHRNERSESGPICARNIPLLAFGWDVVDAVAPFTATYNAAIASARHIAVALRRAAVVAVVVAAEAIITGLDSEPLEAGALGSARSGRW